MRRSRSSTPTRTRSRALVVTAVSLLVLLLLVDPWEGRTDTTRAIGSEPTGPSDAPSAAGPSPTAAVSPPDPGGADVPPPAPVDPSGTPTPSAETPSGTPPVTEPPTAEEREDEPEVTTDPEPGRPATPTGIRIDSGIPDPGVLAARTAVLGRAPEYLMWYRSFADEPDVAVLDAVVATGATAVLTWEPHDWTAGADQPRFALARLLAGDFDTYLTDWAVALATWGGPVHLRFAHEMNGYWYPWSAGANGNTAAEYVEAWRKVHGIFAAAGATNVTWVWSPNVIFPDATPLTELYPGDAYVDVIGVDGYNWGTAVPGETWKSPEEVFGATLDAVARIAPGKPVIIAETGSAEQGGDKAAWVVRMYEWLATREEVRAVIWFDQAKEADWRVDSSPAAARAIHDVLSRP